MRLTDANRKSALRILAVFLIAAFLSSCDSIAENKFHKFCEKNLPAPPAEKVSTRGIEFRGNFSTSRLNWSGFAEFVEISRKDIRSQSSSSSEFRYPAALKHPKYRLEVFDSWTPECRMYWVFRRAPKKLTEEFFETEENEMAENPRIKCQGIYPVNNFEAEYIVERIDNPKFGRVFDRKIFARIFRVTNRASGQVIGEIHAYYVSTPIYYQGYSELPQEYHCTSTGRSWRIGTRDLETIFAQRNKETEQSQN